ncbi:MAG: thiamine-phosphate synthase family protein [Candidatus Poseidoniaceae archaeon]|jgi:predicted fused transcriptional regulator/phosphomethylpyrimidine kinase|nr:thiamine-phosphate synthase family protein [Candidatus Poseidoniaceae archaeon]
MLGDVGSKWLDRLHQDVAKDLRTKGWSQAEIADILGSTQSTISRHIQKSTIELPSSGDEAMVDAWSSELSQALNSLGPKSEVVRQRLVVEFQFKGNHTIRFDKTLTGLDLDQGQEQRALLRRLEWAIGRLDAKRIKDVMPAVGMNIASCNKGARDPSQVAAFPGKISIVDGKLRHHETPSFGASSHLASLLLQSHIMNDAKTSMININPINDDNKIDENKIKQMCQQLGYSFAISNKGKISGSHNKLDVILDTGDFGWEPSMYILAHNPLELIDRTHQIVASL